MNRDINLINRALADAGQEPLTDEAIKENVTTWRTIKDFYLPLLLEMLSSAEWTSHKKRALLEKYEGNNFSNYDNAYILPADCAKPIEIKDNEEYVVEGNILYTDQMGVALLYVSNNKRIAVQQLPEIPDDNKYLVDGIYYEYNNETSQWIEVDEDYHDYDDITLSPEESKCFENLLAAKIALKITGDIKLYQFLLGISEAIRDQAIKQSRSHGVSTEKGNEYWGDILGITENGVYTL